MKHNNVACVKHWLKFLFFGINFCVSVNIIVTCVISEEILCYKDEVWSTLIVNLNTHEKALVSLALTEKQILDDLFHLQFTTILNIIRLKK